MIGLLNIKTLMVGLVLASPSFAAWMIRGAEANTAPSVPIPAQAAMPARIAVEVHTSGEEPRLVQVQVHANSVPEPGSLVLITLTGLLALRRKRS